MCQAEGRKDNSHLTTPKATLSVKDEMEHHVPNQSSAAKLSEVIVFPSHFWDVFW